MLRIAERAPQFELVSVDGRRYVLNDRLTLAIFFKTDCPTCQYSWPFFERLASAYGKSGLQLWGISQHDRSRTREFATEYGKRIPLLIDAGLRASAKYAPDFVPAGFLIDARQTIQAAFASWNKQQFIELGEQIATYLQVAPEPLIGPAEQVAAFKPG